MDIVLQYGVDLALVLVLICTVVRCAQIGLVRALAGILAWIAAAAIALHFCGPLAQTMYDRYFRQRVLEAAIENVSTSQDVQETADVTAAALDDLPDLVVEAAVGMGIDVQALRDQVTNLPQTEHDAAAVVERDLLAPVIVAALKAVTFFVMVMLVAGVLQLLLVPVGRRLHRTPVIGTTDRALGAVLGILKGAVCMSVLAIVLQVAGSMADHPLHTAAENSRIVSFVTESPFADGVFR